MLQLELNDQERAVLEDVLTVFLSELRNEVSHTDLRAYRERLKDEEKAIKTILAKVEMQSATASG